MAPAPIDPRIVDVAPPRKDSLGLPGPTRERLEKAGIDLSSGYPYRPSRPLYIDDVYNIRNFDRSHVDPGTRADPEKKALLSAAKEVFDLTRHIGTEIVGLQLKDLTDQQKDELGLLIAERSVVFFRDQDISPQQQKELGKWFGEIEIHVRKSRSKNSMCILHIVYLLTNCLIHFLASSPAGSWSRRGFCDLARAPSHREPGQLSSTRGIFSMAYRSCPRKAAGWSDPPP
jgi:hypothetical protein